MICAIFAHAPESPAMTSSYKTDEALVLVPGLVCDAYVWQQQVDALGSYRVVPRVTLVADHALCDDLGAMADNLLARAPPKFALAGHSMGGRVAMEVYARAPERVTRLALLDTGSDSLPAGEPGEREKAGRLRLLDIAQREGMLAMGMEWARNMVHPRRLADASLMDSIHRMIARAPLAQFEAQIHALLRRPDRLPLLAQIVVPTLVLCGHDDRWSPPSQHVEMARHIQGCVYVDVPDCGHMCTLEQPAAVTRALSDWLGLEKKT
jgi:pimeloyl-ACP methyl ester carboxylesterase